MADCAFDSDAFDPGAFDTCVSAVQNCENETGLNGLQSNGVPLLFQFATEKDRHWRASENDLDHPIPIPKGW